MLILLSLPVSAHVGGLLQGIDLVFQEAGGIGVETSFGLLWAPDGSSYSWLCHEAITAEGSLMTPRYAYSEAGVFLGLLPVLEQARDTNKPVYRSTDGCDWGPVAGLDGESLTDVAFDPSDAEHALAITADLSDGAENGIRRSTDSGQSFSSVFSSPQRLFRTLRFSAAGSIWASAVWYDSGEGWLYTSSDGESWTERAVPMDASGDELLDVDIIAVHQTDPLTAWVVVGPYGSDVLLRTTDGGETFEEVFSVEGDIIDGDADEQGGVWLAVSGVDFYYAADGESFELIKEPVNGLGIQWGQSATWLAVDALYTGYISQRSVDQGGSIESMFHLSTLTQMSCPEGTDVAERCDSLWADLEVRLPLPLGDDSGEPAIEGDSGGADTGGTAEADCGCRGEESTVLIGLIGFLGLARRRRY